MNILSKWAIVLMIGLFATPVTAAVVVLGPGGKDTYVDNRIRENKLNNNYGSDDRILIGHADISNGNLTDGLLEFDLSGLPLKASKAVVTLTIRPVFDGAGTQATVSVYQITAPWDEDTVTWNTRPTIAATTVASAVVNNNLGEEVSWDITSLYLDWQSGAAPNYGIYFTTGPNNGEGFSFVSGENTVDPSLRPYLEVNACIPNDPPFSPPVAGGVIASDFGPRGEGRFFHRGIDYHADFGTTVSAVESGNIEVIDYQRNGNGGWFVRIEGSGTGHRWSYLHLFEDDSPPRLIDGLVVRSQSPSGEFTLAIRPDTAQFCIIKRSSTGVVQDVFVEKGAGEPPTILGVNARTCVDGGEGFAASGYSGGVDAHLHLQLNRGADNPLLYVNHTPSQQFGISIEKPAHERIKVDKDLKIRFSIDSTAGLDLNKVYVYIDNVPITPAQGRAAFDYGGNLDEDPSRSAEIRHGETVSGVTFEVKPRDSDPRLDGIQTGLDEFWISGIKASGPFGSLGQHTVSVSAYNLKGKWEGAVQSVTVDSVVFRVIE